MTTDASSSQLVNTNGTGVPGPTTGQTQASDSHPAVDWIVLVGSIAGGVIVLIILGIAIGCLVRKKKKNKRRASNLSKRQWQPPSNEDILAASKPILSAASNVAPNSYASITLLHGEPQVASVSGDYDCVGDTRRFLEAPPGHWNCDEKLVKLHVSAAAGKADLKVALSPKVALKPPSAVVVREVKVPVCEDPSSGPYIYPPAALDENRLASPRGRYPLVALEPPWASPVHKSGLVIESSQVSPVRKPEVQQCAVQEDLPLSRTSSQDSVHSVNKEGRGDSYMVMTGSLHCVKKVVLCPEVSYLPLLPAAAEAATFSSSTNGSHCDDGPTYDNVTSAGTLLEESESRSAARCSTSSSDNEYYNSPFDIKCDKGYYNLPVDIKPRVKPRNSRLIQQHEVYSTPLSEV